MSEYGRPETFQSEVVVGKGGLVLNVDALTQGTTMQGSATMLQNFECALEGGYRRIYGYQPWDAAQIVGQGPVLGVKAALSGVFGARLNVGGTSNDIYYSTGSGWTKVNTSTRPGAVNKVRLITYSIDDPVIVGCDGVNPAFKYDGSTYTTLNGASSPTNPKYAEMFNGSLALSGYTNNGGPQALIITAPNTDTDFAAADGAIEINVGDVVTGLKNFRNTLYVFCINRIFKIVSDPVTTYDVDLVTDQIGCIASDTIQECGGDLIYLSQDGFRSVAGTFNIGDVDLSLQSRQIQPFVRDNILPLVETGGVFCSCIIGAKSQYRCLFYSTGQPAASSLGVIGKVEQGQYLSGFNQTFTTYAWSTTLGIQAYSMDCYYVNGVEVAVFGDVSDGYVMELESGSTFNGVNIQAIYSSPYLTFKDASLRKVMQKVTVYTEVEGANTVDLNVVYDFQNTGVLQPPAIAIPFTGTFYTYGNCLYGSANYSATQFPVIKQNLIGSGFVVSFEYTSSGGAPYRIDSYQIVYSNKGRR